MIDLLNKLPEVRVIRVDEKKALSIHATQTSVDDSGEILSSTTATTTFDCFSSPFNLPAPLIDAKTLEECH